MNRTVYAAVGGAIVGALIVFLYFAVLTPIQHSLPPPPPPCTGAQCQVDVDVTGTPPAISVVPPTLVLSGGNLRTIVWHLRNNQYEFRDDCVLFKDPGSANEFSAIGGSGAQCHAMDRNSTNPPSGAWSYQVKVYDKSTGSWLALDPWIRNG